MLTSASQIELHERWFPHLSDTALDRVIDLLEKQSPLLISGCFSRGSLMGCLATHAAWNHEQTAQLCHDAGIIWLNRVVGLAPGLSAVVREWDSRAGQDLSIYADFLQPFLKERLRRSEQSEVPDCDELLEV